MHCNFLKKIINITSWIVTEKLYALVCVIRGSALLVHEVAVAKARPEVDQKKY